MAAVATLALLTSACGDIVTLELPTTDELALVARTPAVQSVVYDADGGQLAVLRREFRDPVSLTEVPDHLIDAVLTAEDRRFHDHRGVDGRAVLRAAVRNYATGETEQGGSTITQQLIKNLYMPEEDRTGATKVREAVLARELERQRSKASILEDYLNTVYFGEGAHGVSAAAWTYFRVEVGDLDVAQSALLAAIIRAPEGLAPTRAPEAAKLRRDDVLRRMTEYGHLSEEDRDAALATPIEVQPRPPAPAAREPHFVDLVVRSLLADPRFGATEAERATRLYEGGLHIHTTLRPDLQELARTTLADTLTDPDDPEAAIAVVDPATGHILAAAGNRSYDELQFDLVTQAQRQPGSTFKTFVLAAAIAAGHHPDSRLDGRQGEVLPGWNVRNYDRHSYRTVTLAGATRASINSAYARLGIDLGLARVAGLARSMGVRSPLPDTDPQLTIGGGSVAVTPLDMAAAYGTLANLGRHVPTTAVVRIDDAEGRTVWLPDTVEQTALAPSAAYVTLEVLRDAVEHGTGMAAQVEGWQVAGKTGTTSDYADAWFVGTTTELAAAVWMGRVEGRIPLEDVQGVRQVTGGSLPASIFSSFMTAALADEEPRPFALPDDEWVLVELDPRSGRLAAPWCPGDYERVPRILVPDETCPQPAPRPAPAPQPPAPPPAPVTPPPVEAPPEPVDEVDTAPEPTPEPTEPAPPGTGSEPPDPPEEEPPAAEPPVAETGAGTVGG